MLASLVAAMVAALCYGIAAVMQAIAVRAASLRPAHAPSGGSLNGVDPGLVVRMLHQWRFIASLALDLVGFVAQLVALRRLPLFAVQAMIAANLAVTAVIVGGAAGGHRGQCRVQAGAHPGRGGHRADRGGILPAAVTRPDPGARRRGR